MQDFEATLERHDLLDRSPGAAKMVSVLLLYPNFRPDRSPVFRILERYGLKPSQLPMPREQDVAKAKRATDGRSRTMDEWIFLTSEPEAPNLTQDEPVMAETDKVPQDSLTPIVAERGQPGEAITV